MLELQNFDSVNNLVYFDSSDFFDEEQYIETKNVIFDQIQDFNNLGQDLLSNQPEDIKNKILTDIIEFAKENYINIVDTDYILNKTQLQKIGGLIYNFLCVDCFNTIIPKLLEKLNCQNIEQFDLIVNKKNKQDPSFIKKQLLLDIGEITQKLIKLKDLDPTIANDTSYKNLVGRFGYYLEIIDFSDINNFLNNYIRPVLNKCFNQILWLTC